MPMPPWVSLIPGPWPADQVLYLMRDTFATARASGSVDGTASEPVDTWVREVDDTESKLTISDGKLTFAGGKASAVWTDPRLYYVTPFSRVAGRALFFRGLIATSGILRAGFYSAQPPNGSLQYENTITISSTAFAGNDRNGNDMGATIVNGTSYDACIILRSAGALIFIKGGVFTQWTLVTPGHVSTTATLYLGFTNFSSVSALDKWEIYDIADYADSDYYSYGDATPASGDSALGEVNGIVEVTWTPASAEVFEVDFRRLDDNNRWIVRCDQAASTIRLVSVDRGITTLGATAAQTWTIGTPFRLLVRYEGLNINTQVGSTAKNSAITAVNQQYRAVKVRDFATATNLYVWPKGVHGVADEPSRYVVSELNLVFPVAYQTFQRDVSDQADIPIRVVLPTTAAIEVEARWQGGIWVSLGTFAGGWCEAELSNQAAGQGLLEVRCSGQTVSAEYIGIGDVFVVAGQSNASGRGTNNQSYAHATLKATLFKNNYTWTELTDPTDVSTGQTDAGVDTTATGSLWPLLATELMAVTGYPVAIVPANWGGTSITQWQPGSDHYNRTTLYGHLAYRAKATGARMALWWQGETDAVGAMSQATYNGNLDTLANAVNGDLSIKLMACKLQNSSGALDANEAAINAAIAEAWGDNVNVLEGPDLTDIASDDSFHLQTDLKLQDAAERWSAKILAAL